MSGRNEPVVASAILVRFLPFFNLYLYRSATFAQNVLDSPQRVIQRFVRQIFVAVQEVNSSDMEYAPGISNNT